MLSACGGSHEPERQVRLEMLSWWTSGGERDAVTELRRIHRARHPNVDIQVRTAETAADANDDLSALFRYGQPPDTFHANAGSMLLSRVLRDTGDVFAPGYRIDSQVQPLDAIYEEASETVWPEVEAAVTEGESRWGVPINVHRINNLYCNLEKLEGRPWPTDVSGLLALVRELSDDLGGPAFGLGVKNNWTLETLAFENILPSITSQQGDLRFYEEFWKGDRLLDDAATHAALDSTLRAFQDLWLDTTVIGTLRLKREGEPPLNAPGEWFQAFDSMMAPESPVALVAMGDWATGYLESKEFVQNEDFGVMPFPGTEELFIFTADAFALPLGAPNPEQTRDLLATVLTREAQVAFNREKGAIPAIRMTPREAMAISPAAGDKVEAFQTSRYRVLAMSGLVTPYIPPPLLRDALAEMMIETESGDAATGRDIVIRALQNHYWLIDSWAGAREGQ